jgi:hypothetical protein
VTTVVIVVNLVVWDEAKVVSVVEVVSPGSEVVDELWLCCVCVGGGVRVGVWLGVSLGLVDDDCSEVVDVVDTTEDEENSELVGTDELELLGGVAVVASPFVACPVG